MDPFDQYVDEYKRQMQLGAVPRAYKGLLEYLLRLRAHFNSKYPQYSASGGLYTGYMDMSYFSLFPASLKNRNLKIAIVFLHEAFRFEVWLSGVNKQAQAKALKQIKDSGWQQYHLVPGVKGYDSIIESVLADNPDFRDLDALTATLEAGTLQFIADVEAFFARQPD